MVHQTIYTHPCKGIATNHIQGCVWNHTWPENTAIHTMSCIDLVNHTFEKCGKPTNDKLMHDGLNRVYDNITLHNTLASNSRQKIIWINYLICLLDNSTLTYLRSSKLYTWAPFIKWLEHGGVIRWTVVRCNCSSLSHLRVRSRAVCPEPAWLGTFLLVTWSALWYGTCGE